MDFRSTTCVKSNRLIRTNSRYPTFYHNVPTAGDIEQFNSRRTKTSLLTKMEEKDFKYNKYSDKVLVNPWNGYIGLSSRDVYNTFQYMFYKFKKGIFVQIRDNRLKTFLPFSNAHFENEWSERIKVDPSKYNSIEDFLTYIASIRGRKLDQKVLPIKNWYANNAIFRYEEGLMETSNNLTTLYDMYKTLCEKRLLPDIDLFVNRRDFPLLTETRTEPYDNIYDSEHVKLLSHRYKKYCPILSFSKKDNYVDVLSPTYEDWARVVYQETGDGILFDCNTYPEIIPIEWKKKIRKAVFRGSSTGAGTTNKNNKRLAALEIASTRPDILDVGITNWNARPRKYKGDKYLSTIERGSYPISERLTKQEQSDYAYILNIEGYVSAYRLSYEMSYGSVILLVESDYHMWYTKRLQPWYHYVPIKADLSDLVTNIEWCLSHDTECETIAANALDFYYNELNMRSILDFLQKTIYDISKLGGNYNYIKDPLEQQLIEEENWFQAYVSHQVAEKRLNKVMEPILFPPNLPRCIGLLDGQWLSLQRFISYQVKKVKTVFQSKNSTIDLVTVGPYTLIAKVANKDKPGKLKENIHETFIGTTTTNKLLAKVPNFAYVYGNLHDSFPKEDAVFKLPFRPNPQRLSMITRVIYVEYISDTNMLQWLTGPDYSWDKFLNLLVQLALALKVAQNECGFVHCDLAPWNIMIQKKPEPSYHHYQILPQTTLKVKSTLVPVMIDFGKSRAVVHQNDKGMRDHGYVNLYRNNNAIADILYLLITSFNVIGLSEQRMYEFDDFFVMAGIKDFTTNSKKYSKYGALFNIPNTNMDPLKFMDYIIQKFGTESPIEYIKIAKSMHNGSLLKGNATFVDAYTLVGNVVDALYVTIWGISEASFGISTTEFFQRQIVRIASERMQWLDEEINKTNSVDLKKKWNMIKGVILSHPVAKNEDPDMTYPTPKSIYLDAEMSPTEIMKISQTAHPLIEKNWAQTKSIFSAATYTKDPFIMTSDQAQMFVELDPFHYQNAIASVNTLHHIKNENLDILKI